MLYFWHSLTFDSRSWIVIARPLTHCKPFRRIIRRPRRLILRNGAFMSRVRVYPCVCTTSDSEGSIHPFRDPFVFPNYPQDLRRAGRWGARRGRTGRYVYCSKLSLLARVAAASHGVIFIIRPFVFSAAARPESNNSARRRPRERFSFPKFLSPFLFLALTISLSLSSPVFLLSFFYNHLLTLRLHLFRPSPLSLSFSGWLPILFPCLSLQHPRASLSLSSAVLMQHLSSSSS